MAGSLGAYYVVIFKFLAQKEISNSLILLVYQRGFEPLASAFGPTLLILQCSAEADPHSHTGRECVLHERPSQ
jgi:hypothetical protein